MENNQTPQNKRPAGRPFGGRGGSRGPSRGGRSLFDKPVPTRTQAKPLGAQFKVSESLKQGFAKEEGSVGPSDKQEVKKHGGGKNRRMGGAFESMPRMSTFKNKPHLKTGTDTDILEQGSDRVKVAVLGGNEEVGRNCTMIEYGNDIILIDLGLQFPDDDMPGVDYIVPNISSLKGKEKNVRGIIITHAHYDHIGGIPHLAPKLGNPPIFGTDLTCGIIAKRQEDHKDKP